MRYTDSLKRHGRATILFDLSIILISAMAVVTVRWGGIDGLGREVRTGALLLSVPVVWFLSLAWQNAWVFTGHENNSENYRRVVRAGIFTLLSVSTISFVLKADFSRIFVIVSVTLGTLLLLLQRQISWRSFLRQTNRIQLKERGLVLAHEDIADLMASLSVDFPDSELIHFNLSEITESLESSLDKTIKDLRIDFMVAGVDLPSSSNAISLFARIADKNDCQLFLVDPLQASAIRRDVQLRGLHMYSRLAEPHLLHSKALFKRSQDILISTIALIFFMPLMLIVALVIKVTSRGPVLYKDRRIGIRGSTFVFPKFRTMYDGADKDRKTVLGVADEGIGERYRRDPRITPVGRFLRRFSLDEFPQFWSVLIGTMSLVGPRPILVEELPQMSEIDEYRHIARPGLTGLWQVSGRKETSWSDRMEMDLEYVHNWSPAMDMVLILRTISAIIMGRGAY